MTTGPSASSKPWGRPAGNRWAAEMEKHCMNIVKDVEKAAGEADELAKFHRLRAKELEGK